MSKTSLGCAVVFFIIFAVLVQAALYYASWVLVTTFTDFNTLVSVILTFILGSIFSSLMGAGIRHYGDD